MDVSTVDTVVATLSLGEIVVGDIEREIRYLRQDERRYRSHEKMSDEQSWTDWIRRMALRKIALHIAQENAQEEGRATDLRLEELARKEARDWWLSLWEKECYGLPHTLPTKEESVKLLAQEEPKMSPARLKLSHIFLRAEGESSISEAVQKLENWRAQIETLEQFGEFAERYSDSQSARRKGSLGFLRKGWLPKAAEDNLYQLAPGTLSQPIPLRGGVHLFFVEKNDPVRPQPLDRQLARLQAEQIFKVRQHCRSERLQKNSLEIQSKAGQDPWSGLKIGDWQISGTLLQDLYSNSKEEPQEIRTNLIENEILFQQAMEEWTEDEKLRLADLRGDVLFRALLDRHLAGLQQEPAEAELRAVFESLRDRYKTKAQMQVRVVMTQVPEKSDPIAFLDGLTSLAERLRQNEVAWQEVSAHLPESAVVEAWPMLPQAEIAGRLSPFLLTQLVNLPPGSVTDPIQQGENFYVVMVDAVEPARPLSFAEALPRVRKKVTRDLRNQQSVDFAVSLLTNYEFQLTAEGAQKTGSPMRAIQAETEGQMPKEHDAVDLQ